MRIEIVECVRQADERGFLSVPLTDDELRGTHNVHVVSLQPGKVRGNHYHVHQTEYLCLLGGRCLLAVEDLETGERREEVLEGERSPRVKVPPRVAHAVRNVGDETLYLLCFTDRPFSEEERDFVPRRVIAG